MSISLVWDILSSMTFVTSTFPNRNFNYQPCICDGCHNTTLCAQAITDINIITIKSGTYKVVSSISCEKSNESNNLDEKLGCL